MKQKPTPAQIDALAGYLSSLRPGQHRWTKVAIVDELNHAVREGIADDVLALTIGSTRYALTARNETPDALAVRGPHWDFTGLATAAGRPVVDEPHCGRCHTIHGPEGPLDAPGSLCPTGPPADIAANAAAARQALKGHTP